MKTLFSPLAVYLIVTLAIAHISKAQNSPKDYLQTHNAARAEVGVSPLIWNATLADFSKNLSIQRIKDCNLVDASPPSGYGENIAEASYPIAGVEAVKLWANEKVYYDYDKNECVGRNCWHYIQAVWNRTIGVGCERSRCNNGIWFVSCNYYPPSNLFDRPYAKPKN